MLDNYLERIFEKKSKISAESSILDEIPYIKSVMNPYDSIYKAVEKNMSDDLNIMLIDGPMGIGKTRSIMEAWDKHFRKKWMECFLLIVMRFKMKMQPHLNLYKLSAN